MCLSRSMSVSWARFLEVKNKGMLKSKSEGEVPGCHCSPSLHSCLLHHPPCLTGSQFPSLLVMCHVLGEAMELKRGVTCSSCPLRVYRPGRLSGIWRNGGEQINGRRLWLSFPWSTWISWKSQKTKALPLIRPASTQWGADGNLLKNYLRSH